MSLLFKQLFQLIRLLNSENGTNQIAAGVAAGFVLGMTPMFSLQSVLLIVLVLVFRIQIGAVLVAGFFFAFPAFLLDPLFHQVGEMVLTAKSMEGVFTSMYNMPIIPFTRFNNTVVMGSGVVAFLLSPLIFYVTKLLVSKYRVVVLARLKATKFWKAVQASSFYRWYYKYDQYEW